MIVIGPSGRAVSSEISRVDEAPSADDAGTMLASALSATLARHRKKHRVPIDLTNRNLQAGATKVLRSKLIACLAG